MAKSGNKPAWIVGVLLGVALLLVVVARVRHGRDDGDRQKREKLPAPVEVAPVQRGVLTFRRTFSGSVEPRAQFAVAPKVSGRIERLHVDVSDTVTRGQVVAELEDAEFKQAVAEAEARLTVAQATHAEAESRLVIAQRERERAGALHERGIASDSTRDAAEAAFLASQAAVKVAEADVAREAAALEGARIRLGYSRIAAEWEQGDDTRTVAERFADEGNTVAANTPLLSIVELDPVVAVIQVTEKDYPRLSLGQSASIRSDAFPGHVFTGAVTRIAPVFQAASRQARVEVNVPNPEHRLKPGMFTRCTLELARAEEALSVPELAITRRGEETGVFLVSPDRQSVSWVAVETGLKDGEQVQIVGGDLSGEVVTLGQQLIDDGSAIRVAGETPGGEAPTP